MPDKIIELIKKSETIAVLTHISEDADALGSAAAFASAMENIGKSADIYISETPEARLSFIDKKFIIYSSEIKTRYDLCVCLDSGDLKRLGKRIEIFNSAMHTINIDHHVTNHGYAEENMVVGNASSTGEILYTLFKRMGEEITDKIAEYLYISIVSDTGCFKYSNTSPTTMRIAAELIGHNFDHAEICRLLFDTEKREVLRLKGYIMENIHEYFDGKLYVVSVADNIFKDYGVNEKDTGDLVNIPRSVEGCEIAVAVRQSTDRIKVSLRSNGKYDVSQIAVSLGGGGHKMAAGVSFKNQTIDNVEQKIVTYCKEHFDIE